MPLSPNSFYDSDLVAKRKTEDQRPWNQRLRFPDMTEGATPLVSELPGGSDARTPSYTPEGMQAMQDAMPDSMTDGPRKTPGVGLGGNFANMNSPMKRQGAPDDELSRLLGRLLDRDFGGGGMISPPGLPDTSDDSGPSWDFGE